MTGIVSQSIKIVLIMTSSAALAMMAAWYGNELSKRPNLPPTAHSIGPAVIQLEKIGELTTMRVHVTDILSAEGEGYRGSWLIKGDALLSCDMTKAKICGVDTEKHTATIRLPPIRVASARVDHHKTKTWSVEKTTWLPWKWGDQGIVQDTAMFHAQRLIESSAGADSNVDLAKVQAEQLIRQTYFAINWNVDIEWE